MGSREGDATGLSEGRAVGLSVAGLSDSVAVVGTSDVPIITPPGPRTFSNILYVARTSLVVSK